MHSSLTASRRPLRVAFMMAAMAVTFLVASIASADPPKKKKNGPRRESLALGGTSAFLLGYGYAAGMGALEYKTSEGRAASDMFVPVAGPYMALAQNQVSFRNLASTKLAGGYFQDRNGSATVGDAIVFGGAVVLADFEYALLLADPIVQGIGLGTAAAGSFAPHDASRTNASAPPSPRWSVGPAWNAGPGVALSVTSW